MRGGQARLPFPGGIDQVGPPTSKRPDADRAYLLCGFAEGAVAFGQDRKGRGFEFFAVRSDLLSRSCVSKKSSVAPITRTMNTISRRKTAYILRRTPGKIIFLIKDLYWRAFDLCLLVT